MCASTLYGQVSSHPHPHHVLSSHQHHHHHPAHRHSHHYNSSSPFHPFHQPLVHSQHRALESYYQQATADTLILPQSFLLFYASSVDERKDSAAADIPLVHHHHHHHYHHHHQQQHRRLRIQHTMSVPEQTSTASPSSSSTVLFDRLEIESNSIVHHIPPTTTTTGVVSKPGRPLLPPKPTTKDKGAAKSTALSLLNDQDCSSSGRSRRDGQHADNSVQRRCSANCVEYYLHHDAGGYDRHDVVPLTCQTSTEQQQQQCPPWPKSKDNGNIGSSNAREHEMTVSCDDHSSLEVAAIRELLAVKGKSTALARSASLRLPSSARLASSTGRRADGRAVLVATVGDIASRDDDDERDDNAAMTASMPLSLASKPTADWQADLQRLAEGDNINTTTTATTTTSIESTRIFAKKRPPPPPPLSARRSLGESVPATVGNHNTSHTESTTEQAKEESQVSPGSANSVTTLVARFEQQFQQKATTQLSRSFSLPRRSFHEVPYFGSMHTPTNTMLPTTTSTTSHKCFTTAGQHQPQQQQQPQCFNCCCCCCPRCQPQSLLGVPLRQSECSSHSSPAKSSSKSASPNVVRPKHKVKCLSTTAATSATEGGGGGALDSKDSSSPPKSAKSRKSRSKTHGGEVKQSPPSQLLQPPPPASSVEIDLEELGKSSSNELLSTSSTTTSATNCANSSTSDNSSTDEGIENPTVLEEFDDDFEHFEQKCKPADDNNSLNSTHTLGGGSGGPKSSHSHHEHHRNHHHSHSANAPQQQQLLQHLLHSADFTSNQSPNVTSSVNNFNKLRNEESNLLQEIAQLEQEQHRPASSALSQSRKPKPEATTTAADDNDDEEREDDEELLEFQSIEREIKLSELRKCLSVVQKQIDHYQRRMSFDAAMDKLEGQMMHEQSKQQHSLPLSMTDSMIERSRKTAEDQLNLSCLKTAPLAEPDPDTESVRLSQTELAAEIVPVSSVVATTTTATSNVASSVEIKHNGKLVEGIGKLVLSDTDDTDDDEDEHGPANAKAANVNNYDDDLRHDSMEQSLGKVNKVHDDDDDDEDEGSFIVESPSKPVKGVESGVLRRGSRYDNERSHRRCDLVHHTTTTTSALVTTDPVKMDKMLQRIMPQSTSPYYTSLMSQSLGELIEPSQHTTTLDPDGFDPRAQQSKPKEAKAKASQAEPIDTLPVPPGVENPSDEAVVIRRRSGRFPNESNNDDSHAVATGKAETEDNQENSATATALRRRLTSNSNSSITGGSSQRPLTLYMPAPNQELNLITHLHALGHDLTSSIVTNHLLITPFTCSGYLYKQCASSTHKWRKRYFHFNRVRKVFVYFKDRTAFEKKRHPKRGVFFAEIQDVYVDHARINMKKLTNFSAKEKSDQASASCAGDGLRPRSPMARGGGEKRKFDGTRRIFVVSTTAPSRKFTLSTYLPELMSIWMDVIFTGASAYLHNFEAYDEEHN